MAPTQTSDHDADLAGTLVREAGQLAHRMRAEGLVADQKSSISDLVTAADRGAEELVTGRLRDQRPADSILGEEGASYDGTSGRRWIIDPVDGTYNFFHELDWWCCALALVDDRGEHVLGAIYHAGSDTLWLGGPERPTTKNEKPVAGIVDRPLDEVCAASYFHPPRFREPEQLAAFTRAVQGAAALRMLGSSSMDLAAVADGRLGVWFQHSVPEWDWRPGSSLVLGAGGAARKVWAGGVEWSVAGAPTAVAEVCARLAGDGEDQG